MTTMNKPRLTARENGYAHFPRCFEEPCAGNGCGGRETHCEFLNTVCDRLCELEEKLEQGALLEPPVKIGDKVYSVIGDDGAREMDCEPIESYTVFGLSYANGRWAVVDYSNCEFLVGGDLCLLTLAEAEERLAEKRRKKGGSHSC